MQLLKGFIFNQDMTLKLSALNLLVEKLETVTVQYK